MILLHSEPKKVVNFSKFRPLAGWLLVGSFVAAMGTTMMAAEAAEGGGGTGVQCDPAFTAAVASGLARHVKVVDVFMAQAQVQMQNAVSASSNKCIGDIAFGNFDISFLIPDLGGLLSALLQSVIQRIIDGLTKRFCSAVNDQLTGAQTSWNNAINGINKQLDIEGQMQVWGRGVDSRIQNVTDRCVVNPSSCANNTQASPLATTPAQVPVPVPDPVPGSVVPASAPDPTLRPTTQPSSGDFTLPVRQ